MRVIGGAIYACAVIRALRAACAWLSGDIDDARLFVIGVLAAVLFFASGPHELGASRADHSGFL